MNLRAIGTRGLIITLIAGIIAILLPTVSLAQQIQAGQAALSGGSPGINHYTITLPTAFSSIPRVTATAQWQDNSGDADAVPVVVIGRVTTTSFQASLILVHSNGTVAAYGWSGTMRLNWIAWD